jgi:putative ABC transport system permease protein
MNIVNKLTLKYMMKNKNRTIVTIIGVIISVAMIAAASSISVSFLNMLQRSTATQTGNWHAAFLNVKGADVNQITSSNAIKDNIISHTVGFGELPDSKSSQRPYVYIIEANNFNLAALPLMEGNYPKTKDEIVISTKLIDVAGMNYKIGDKVRFDIGYRTITENNEITTLERSDKYITGELFHKTEQKEYTITGIVDASNRDYLSRAGFPIFSGLELSSINANEQYDVYSEFKQINKEIYKTAEKLASKVSIEKPEYNSELLLYYGISSDDYIITTLRIATLIVGVIILLGSVSLIYNAFAISLSERSKTLGMLASVGATKQQKRNSVLFEGFIIGSIAIPIGLVCGYLGIGLTFWLMNPIVMKVFHVTEPLKLIISKEGFIGSILFSILVLFISAWYPAKRASKISPIDAIRQSQDIHIKSKDIKTLKLTKIIFGFEGELGLKNIKRSKHRYYATLLSMIISIILFLTASSFSVFLNKSFNMAQAPIPYDLVVTVDGDNKEYINEFIDEIAPLKSAYKSTVSEQLYTYTDLDKDKVSLDVRERISLFEGKYPMGVSLISMDDTTLKQYGAEVGISFEQLKTDALKGILVNKFNLKEEHKYTTVEQLSIETGSLLPFYVYDDNGNMISNEIQIAAITDKLPICMNSYQETLSEITVIVSEQSINALIHILEQEQNYSLYNSYHVYYKTDNAIDLEKEIENVKSNYYDINSYIYNVVTQRQQQQRLSIIFSIFLYGFVALIAVICTANIINTISTGVQMRKREFAMLKSFGITPRGFERMIRFESLFYGIKALLYGLPISFIVVYLVYKALSRNFDFTFFLPGKSILYAFIGVFILVGSTSIFSIHKIRKDNIIDALKNENL